MKLAPSSQETARVLKERDWSAHPLGEISSWSPVLLTTLNLLFQARSPMFIFWGKELFCFYNDGYIPILGSQKHPVAMGQTADIVWPETYDDLVVPQMKKVFQGESTWNEHQHVVLLRDGEKIEGYYSNGYTPLYDENGKVGGALLVVAETTSANRALHSSELRFKQIAESLPQLVWTCFPDGNCNYLSKQWEDYTGITQDAQLGFNWLDIVIHPDDRDRVSNHWMGAVKGMHPYDIDYRIRRHDGAFRWFKTRGTPLRNELGEITYWFGTCTDINDERESQEKLQSTQGLMDIERQKLEAIFEDSPIGMALLRGEDFIFEKINPRYAELVSHPAIIGHRFMDVLPDLKDQPFLELLQGVYESGETFQGSEVPVKYARWETGKIEETFFDVTYSRVTSGDGIPYGVLICANDVTNSVRTRKRLEELSAELTRAVLSRDDFLSIASHELKTPLTSLLIQSQLHDKLINENHPTALEKGRIQKFIKIVQKQSDRLNRLVNDMLDVSRIQTGLLKIAPEKVNLGDIITDTVLRHESQFIATVEEAPEIKLSGDLMGEMDSLRIEQVVTNIMTNAMKYGDRKPIQVSVFSWGESLRIEIEDQGRGVPELERERIFERYERSISSNEVSGLGLGLYISRQIVRAHGGRIWVEDGKSGSRFVVELPRKFKGTTAADLLD